MRRQIASSLLYICIAIAAQLSSVAHAATISKADNITALSSTGSWVGNVVPSASDIARWDSTMTTGRTASIGGNVSFAGIQITTASGTQTISGSTGYAMTLGASGIDMSAASTDLTITSILNLGANQTWSVAAGRTLQVSPGSTGTNTGSATLTLTGPGNARFGNGVTHLGTGTGVLGGGINLGSINSTGRTISNPITLAGDFGITSTSVVSTGGINLSGGMDLGGANRTVTLSSTTSSATIPPLVLSGTATAASGTLILVNGNPGLSPVTSVGMSGGCSIQCPLEIGNTVTVFVTGSNKIFSGKTLTLDAGGTLNMAQTTAGTAFNQKVGSLAGAGLVTSNAQTASTGVLTVDGGTNTTASTFSGQITNTANATVALTKLGNTTQILTGSNTYAGATTVSGGTLQLGNNSASATFLADTGRVNLNTGGILNLSFTSNSVCEAIGSLYIDGVQKATGSWGPIGSGATNTSALITGTGILGVGTVPPSITTQPTSQTVTSGSTAVFSVAATGVPAPTYQWQKNGVDMSGQTSTTLTLTNVSPSDAANYDVVASNSAGQVTSNTVTLTVNVAPTITSQPTPQTVNSGDTAAFTVAATGIPSPTYQWRKGGANIGGATSATLTLPNVGPSDAANYDVVVTNVVGSVTSNAVALTVNVAPTITSQPTPQTVTSGSTAVFTIGASGTPTPTYQWQRNGVDMAGKTSATLTLTNVSPSDAANYDVVVTNILGSVTSNAVALTVNVAPTITTQPISQTTGSGGTASFSVVATGTPTPTYQWKKAGVDMSGKTSSVLTLTNVTSADASTYTVVVSNAAGSVTSSAATLTVLAAIVKANNTTALSSTGSWVGGVVPSASNVASWNSTSGGTKTVSIGGNVSFGGIQVTNVTGSQTISTTAGCAMTLGASGIDMSAASADLILTSILNLGANQTWSVAAGRTVQVSPGSTGTNTGSATLTLTGPGNARFGNGVTHLGTGTVVLGGGINLGSINTTGRTLKNPITFAGDITIYSTSIVSTGGISLSGSTDLGGADRTVTLSSTTSSAIVPPLVISGTTTAASGTGTLILVNGNAGLSPVTSVGLSGNCSIRCGLEIGNTVTVFMTGDNKIFSDKTLTVDAGGTLNMAQTTPGYAFSQKVGALAGAGVVTSNAQTVSTGTLTIDGGTNTTTSTFSGQITDSGTAGKVALTKSGSTTQVLTGSNSYSGATTVNDGVLQLGNNSATANFLPAATPLYLYTNTGTLNLSFTSNAVQQGVGSIYIDNVKQNPGVYGPIGSGAENEIAFITGTGMVRAGIITSQPFGTTVAYGSNVTFTVTAVPSPTPTYQWMKNGASIDGAINTSATTASLTLNNVQLGDAADYTVLVTNANGSQTSAVATLVVNQLPIIQTPPTSGTSADGLNTKFVVAATGFPAVTYQWKKNGVAVTGATNSSLALNCLATTDAGGYTVTITNSQGAVTSSTATLTVTHDDRVVNVEMDDVDGVTKYIFSWTFDQPVTRGYFVDGQPWIIRPAGGVNLTAVSPARQDGVTVYLLTIDNSDGTHTYPTTTGTINMTVVNPPIGDWYTYPTVKNNKPAFGWDSRGCLRSATNGYMYDKNLGWDGSTAKALNAGDSVTTAYSVLGHLDNITVLQALAVLRVLDSAPPTGAFRPGFTYNPNPEWFRLSDIIDLSSHLIPAPTTDLCGHNLSDLQGQGVYASGTVPSDWTGDALTSLMPGPTFLNATTQAARTTNAVYNNSGCTYGQYVMENVGDVAVGALAAWLTPEQRQTCQIHLLQRAIDTYTAMKAGLYFNYDGGQEGGYAALLTIAGKMFNHAGMLSVNDGVLLVDGTTTLNPEFYFADYAEVFCLVNNPSVQGPNEPPLTSLRRVDFHNPNLTYNLSSTCSGAHAFPAVASSSSNTLVVSDTFKWPGYRPGFELLNLKLRINSGTGAGSTIYTVTDFTNFWYWVTGTSGSTWTCGTNRSVPEASGGTLTVTPPWANGVQPDANSIITASVGAQSEMSCWGFKDDGMAADGTFDIKTLDLSPDTGYLSIGVGSYLTLYVALYALDGEIPDGNGRAYKSGMDKFMINISAIRGYGEVSFDNSNGRLIGDPTPYSGDDRGFVGGLWKHVLDKATVNKTYVWSTGTDCGTTHGLPAVPVGSKLWNEQ